MSEIMKTSFKMKFLKLREEKVKLMHFNIASCFFSFILKFLIIWLMKQDQIFH